MLSEKEFVEGLMSEKEFVESLIEIWGEDVTLGELLESLKEKEELS